MDENDLTPEELAAFEKQLLSDLKPDADDPVFERQAPGGDQPPASAPPAPTPPAAPAPAAAPTAAAPAAPAAPAPAGTPAEPDLGDPRAALRASRRSERQARERAEQRERENEQLRKQLAELRGTPATPEGVDPEMAALELDVPGVAPVVKRLLNEVKELRQQIAAPKQAPEPDFVPERLHEALQEIVDDIPQLLAWQTSPRFKDHWELAKATDLALTKHRDWKDKPEAERLQETARRVAAELGAPSPTPPAPAPTRAAQRIQDAPERGLETLSDLRGGVVPSTSTGQDFYAMKSDEEVMAALEKLR